jgi:SAM-dependent methyltransferase
MKPLGHSPPLIRASRARPLHGRFASIAGVDAEAWNERYAASELLWSVGPNQFVEAECAELPPGRALDLAAGEGRNAIWLARRGWDVTAVDFSQVALDKGRTLAGGVEVEWVCADATTWTRADAYDLVVIAYLQLQASERREAVRRGFAALRSGGTFLLVGHDTTNLTEGTGGPQDASVLLTAEDVLTDLAGEELEVIRAGRVDRMVASLDEPGVAEHGAHKHVAESTRTAYDCLVRLRRP